MFRRSERVLALLAHIAEHDGQISYSAALAIRQAGQAMIGWEYHDGKTAAIPINSI